MTIDLNSISVSQNARLYTKQSVHYGDTHLSFPITLLDQGPFNLQSVHNSSGQWTRSGQDRRLSRSSNKKELYPFSRDANLSRNLLGENRMRQEKVDEMAAKDKDVQNSYEVLRNICMEVTQSLGQEYACVKTIRQEVEVQQIRFAITSRALLKALKDASLNEIRNCIISYTRLIGQLEAISKLLDDVPQHLATILGKFQEAKRRKSTLEEQNSAEECCPDQEFRDVLMAVEPDLDKFDLLANSLIKQPATVEAGEELKRLYVEGLAATTLFRCLSRACPVGSHRSHTIYLGLSTDDTAVHMAVQSRARRENRVWLRVQSTVDAIVAKETKTRASVQVSETPTRKRKLRSSTSSPPPLKARKTSRGRVANDEWGEDLATMSRSSRPAIDQVQVCPEYLTQDEDSSLVMRMVGASEEWHNIYFLDPQQRPPQKYAPMDLANIFSHYRDILWRVRVARLVAEAVLRIQYTRSLCHWGEKDVVFYDVEAPYNDLKPFLKVEIERQQNETTPDTMMASRSGRWLLNLALILLQLGLFRQIDAPPEGMGDEQYREHILRQMEMANDRSAEKYLGVVRNCVELNSEDEDDHTDADGQEFRKRYYQVIIFPLKMIEEDLKPSDDINYPDYE